jgi:ABC-type multidrug transport system fused ATPase/permease subunit
VGIFDFFVWMFWVYITIACIWIFITIIIDVFRDPALSGGGKALWVLFLVFVPFLAAFIYLIARGAKMSQRQVEQAQKAQAETNSYIRDVAGTASPSAEIESGKRLLDSGTISQAEFDTIKASALAAA